MSTLAQVQADIIGTVKAYARGERKSSELVDKIAEILHPKEGAKLDKNLANYLAKQLGDGYEVTWDNSIHSLKYINVKILDGKLRAGHKGYHLENGYQLHFGYDSTTHYFEGHPAKSHSGFTYYSMSYGAAAVSRAAKCEAFLADKTKVKQLAKAIHMLKEAQEILTHNEFGSYALPARYDIDRALGIAKEDN